VVLSADNGLSCREAARDDQRKRAANADFQAILRTYRRATTFAPLNGCPLIDRRRRDQFFIAIVNDTVISQG
jgi:hypothetical protein